MLKVFRGTGKRIGSERNLGSAKKENKRGEKVAEAEKRCEGQSVDQERRGKRCEEVREDIEVIPESAWHWIPPIDRRCDFATENCRAEAIASISVIAIHRPVRDLRGDHPQVQRSSAVFFASSRSSCDPCPDDRSLVSRLRKFALRKRRMRGYRARNSRQTRRSDSELD